MHFHFGPGRRGRMPFPPPIAAMFAGWGPHSEGDWEAEWGPGRPGRKRRRFDAAQLRLVLLKLIADTPRHGYDLIRAIEEMTHGIYAPSPGVVYPTLSMLHEMGLIEEADAEGPRRPFAATAEGRAHLEENADEVERLTARLAGMGENRRKANVAPVARAVKNLLAAIWGRVTADDMSEERLHEIAAVLDEAAQRIERLK